MKKWKVGWGPVAACNMKCVFCYSKKTRKEADSLGLNDWIAFIDANHERISEINYGTGENTLSDDWFTLVEYVKENYGHIAQAVTTNGYLSVKTRDLRTSAIVRKSIDEVDISLDFAVPDIHNKFRGHHRAYEWALNTLRFCRDAGIRSTIVFLGTEMTLSEPNIDGLFEVARNNGAKLRMNLYRPVNSINEDSIQFIPGYQKIIDTLYYIDRKYKILAICDPLFSSFLTQNDHRNDPSGTQSIRILADGSITPSTYLISPEFRRTNITAKDALDRIESEDIFDDIRAAPIPEYCTRCRFVSTCKGGVIDRRYLWYGDFNERDPYCPFRFTNDTSFKQVTVRKDPGFTSIHDGYLPTIFFSP